MENSRIYSTIADLEKTIAYQTGVVLEGITFTRKNTHWVMTIKVRGKKGEPLVAFVDAHTIADLLQFLDAAIHTKAVHLKWYPDRFRT